MKKFKSVNCYEKDGKKFLVLKTENGDAYSLNIGLLNYALNNPKQVKKENK